jgi:hypothetical protein
METFDTLKRRIETAYVDLDHQLGWRFLYTPARTLRPGMPLALVPINPAGSRFLPPAPSVECGNAYRIECWGKRGRHNPLQRQVMRFYCELARALGRAPKSLMDDTLAANFCPFRSPRWDKRHLPNWWPTIRFSAELWDSVLDVAHPRALVCLGEPPYKQLCALLERRGGVLAATPKPLPINWGTYRCELAWYEAPQGQTLIAYVPHLSTFKIFGRRESRPSTEALVAAVAAAMQGA